VGDLQPHQCISGPLTNKIFSRPLFESLLNSFTFGARRTAASVRIQSNARNSGVQRCLHRFHEQFTRICFICAKRSIILGGPQNLQSDDSFFFTASTNHAIPQSLLLEVLRSYRTSPQQIKRATVMILVTYIPQILSEQIRAGRKLQLSRKPERLNKDCLTVA
jgi:hypothetical protein